jgi:hypothetical protein
LGDQKISNYYLAARFGRRFELRGYRDDLRAIGHTVTSRWLDIAQEDHSPESQIQCAVVDMDDLACLVPAFSGAD